MKTKCVQKIKSLGATEMEIFVLNDEVAYGRTRGRTYVRKNRDIEGAPLLKNVWIHTRYTFIMIHLIFSVFTDIQFIEQNNQN